MKIVGLLEHEEHLVILNTQKNGKNYTFNRPNWPGDRKGHQACESKSSWWKDSLCKLDDDSEYDQDRQMPD